MTLDVKSIDELNNNTWLVWTDNFIIEDGTPLAKRATLTEVKSFVKSDLVASDVTDFDTEVSNNTDVAANTSARHSHSNKSLLDTYTQTEANLSDAVTKKHTHSNKTILDQIANNPVETISAGTGVTVSRVWNTVTVNSTASGSWHIIQDEGVSLTQRAKLNFKGATVEVTDDSVNDATIVTISAGSGGWDVSAVWSLTADKIILWDGTTNVKTSSKGIVTTLGTDDTSVPTSKAVFDVTEVKATMFPGICAKTPIWADDIILDYTARTLTIVPPLWYFYFYTDGNGVTTKHVKTGNVVFPAWTDTYGIWYFYFDNTGTAVTTQTAWTDFWTIASVYRMLWNDTLSWSEKSTVENIETHQNTISAQDHEWKHTYGTIRVSGWVLANNKITTGSPAADGSNTVVWLTTIRNIDDNLEYTVTNTTSPGNWNQDLGQTTAGSLNATNSWQFKIRTSDSSGRTVMLPATRFPFPWNSSTNRPEYVTANGTRTTVNNGYYLVVYMYSTQDPRNWESIRLTTTTTDYPTLTLADASVWTDIQSTYPTLNDNEIRPLYKLIYEIKTIYDVWAKYAALRQTDDLRKTSVTTTVWLAGSLPASSVTYVPTGNISSGNVQEAITELDTEKISKAGDSMTGALNEAKGIDIASDTTTDIGAATGNYVEVTGTTTITWLGTVQAGTRRVVKFTDILTLTYNVTSLILPTSANITTQAWDTATFVSLGSGNWICVSYLRNDWTALVWLTSSSTNTLTNKRITKRVWSTTSSSTPTINTDNVDIYKLTAQAVDITSFTTNLSWTPTDWQLLWIQITGTAARAITWWTSFEASTVALPTTTVTTARLDVWFVWNTVTNKWRCVAVA